LERARADVDVNGIPIRCKQHQHGVIDGAVLRVKCRHCVKHLGVASVEHRFRVSDGVQLVDEITP